MSDDKRRALEKYRDRLLDLTLRNPVLNFSPTRKKVVPIADELPDFVYQQLVGRRKPFRIDHAPAPEVEKDNLLGLPAPTAEPTGSVKEKPTEERLLTALEVKQLPTLPTAEDPSPQHRDNSLQSTLTLGDYENRLAAVLTEYRSLLDSTGSNFLYLAIGLLRWSTAREPEKDRLAPLLLIPLEMKRGKETITLHDQDGVPFKATYFAYSVKYSDEQVSGNSTLRLKLAQEFPSIDLPSPDCEKSDFSPEAYLAEVKRFLKVLHLPGTEGWSVERQMAISFFASSKEVQWGDLDPDNWKGEIPLIDHPLVSTALGFGEPREDHLSASGREADATISYDEPIPTVLEADSSQMKALRSGLRDDSVVIQGPPGTGKSQTIANLLAALLADGKRVLFMAEKPEALRVVAQRLTDVGLGDCCLELHSQKATPKQLYAQLRKRLEAKIPDSDVSIKSLATKLSKTEKQLSRVGTQLHQISPETGSSLLHTLWRREAAFLKTQKLWQDRHPDQSFLPEVVSKLLGNKNLTLLQFEDAQQALQKVQQAWEDDAPALAKIWGGFSPLRLLHQRDLNLLTISFEEGRETLETLAGIFARHRVLFPESHSFADQLQTLAIVGELEWADNSCAPVLADYGLLAQNKPWSFFEEQGEALTRATERFKQFDSRAELHKALDAPSIVEMKGMVAGVENAAQTCQELLRPTASPADLTEAWDASKQLAPPLSNFLEQLPATLEALGLTENYQEADDALTLLGLLADLFQLDQNVRRVLRLSAHAPGVLRRTVADAVADAEDLERQEKALASQLVLDRIRRDADLDRTVNDLQELSVSFWKFPFFGKKSRAKRLARTWARNQKQDVLAPDFLDEVAKAATFFKDETAFEQKAIYQEDLGALFEGRQTDWGPFHGAISLHETIKSLPRADQPQLLQLTQNEEWDPQWKETINHLQTQLRLVLEHPHIGFFREDPDQGSLPELYQRFSNFEAQYHQLYPQLSVWEGADELSFQEIIGETTIASAGLAAWEELITLAQPLGPTLEGLAQQRNLEALEVVSKSQRYLSMLVSLFPSEPEAVRYLLSRQSESSLRDLIDDFSEAEARRQQLQRMQDELATFSKLDPNLQFCPLPPAEVKKPDFRLADYLKAFSPTRDDLSKLPLWSDYQVALSSLASTNLSEVVSFCEENDLPPAALVPLATFIFWDHHAERAVSESSDLSQLSGFDLRTLAKTFRKNDARLPSEFRKQVQRDVLFDPKFCPAGNSSGKVSSYTEMGTLRNELSKQMRYLPIRKAVSRAPESLTRLLPCWLMSPASVAKFVPPDKVVFDAVVIDEASQVTPEDALGALARAKRAIIVGDSKQMPPSNTFASNRPLINLDDEDDEDDDPGELSESILDAAESTSLFTLESLRWHYRSQHESLINFSNERYYQGSLVIPPSVEGATSDLGISWNYLAEATFKTGLNEVEAQALTNAFCQRITEEAEKVEPQRTSLGLVVMNSKQASRVRDLIDQRRLDDADFSIAYDAFHENGFPEAFIRNLERVQGDERDEIFIGFTYGPAPGSGKVARRFGPINGKAGQRRLNVLLTRAKKRMVVFSSMRKADLMGGTAGGGVHDLADFLGYAESGQYEEPGETTGAAPDSPFEVSVGEVIETMGYQVDYQVGVSGFRIDLGVKRIGDSRYLCGVECDGATYHSHPVARDRDRLRQDILEARGWAIYRIWSTHWFRNRETEIERLQQHLRALENRAFG